MHHKELATIVMYNDFLNYKSELLSRLRDHI